TSPRAGANTIPDPFPSGWVEPAAQRPGVVRLDQGSGREIRVWSLEAHQRLGQAPGLPCSDGRLGRRASDAGLLRGLPQGPGDPRHATRHRGRPVELRIGSGRVEIRFRSLGATHRMPELSVDALHPPYNRQTVLMEQTLTHPPERFRCTAAGPGNGVVRT